MRPDRLPYDTDVVTEQIFAASQMLTRLTGEAVQANKAIVGRNAFAHEAGIHQDGMLKDRRTYEIMRPEDVGVPATTLVLGKHSGRHAVQHRVQQLGLELERLELDRLYRRMVALADQQKTVSDAELVQMITDLRQSPTRSPPPRSATSTGPAPKRSATGMASDSICIGSDRVDDRVRVEAPISVVPDRIRINPQSDPIDRPDIATCIYT